MSIRSIVRGCTLLAASSLLGAVSLAAQTPKVLFACYVPLTGTVYRIKEPDVKPACAALTHIEFSWTDGVNALRTGSAAGGDLSGVFPNPTVAKLLGRALNVTPPTAGQVLTWNGTEWLPTTPSAGATDHAALTGLGADDHPQYLRGDGIRALTGNWSVGGFRLTGVGAGTTAGDALVHGQAAGGDLSGSFPNPSVTRLQGNPVSAGVPASGNVLSWSGTTWQPTAPAAGVSDHGVLTGLADDDHSQYVLASGVRTGSTGFAVDGAFGTGSIPATGAGTRLMWYPAKAAFRVGQVVSALWDDVNVGTHSIAMGLQTKASGPSSLAMGSHSIASAQNAVAIGQSANASGSGSTAMGDQTVASANVATAMGSSTVASGIASTAIGSQTAASGDISTAMGQFTVASGRVSFAAGASSVASGTNSVALGNLATASATSAVAIGDHSVASGQSSVAIGSITRASALAATAMGDQTLASGNVSTAMGSSTVASGVAATSMGGQTLASANFSTATGQSSTASGIASLAAGISTVASGANSVAMGNTTTASGSATTAMGSFASTNGKNGAFAYGDNSTTGVVTAAVANEFVVRAAGGFRFRTASDLSTGCNLPAGSGVFSCTSSRASKESFQDLDGESVLRKLASIPIQSWHYNSEQSGVRHVGPTAEDFHAAFGLGPSDKAIGHIDADGINMRAIQALELRTRELAALTAADRDKTREIMALKIRLQQLESRLGQFIGAKP